MPSPWRSSAWATLPSSSSWTAFLSKPRAVVRNSIAARASSYLRVGKTVTMPCRLGGARRLVLDEWELVGRRVRELPEVAAQVGLVVVAGVERDVAERRAAALRDQLASALEAQDPRVGLGRHADRVGKAAGEVAAAPAQVLGQRADRRAAAGLDQARPGGQHGRRRLGRGV